MLGAAQDHLFHLDVFLELFAIQLIHLAKLLEEDRLGDGRIKEEQPKVSRFYGYDLWRFFSSDQNIPKEINLPFFRGEHPY